MNARFWVWWNHDWVKLTLTPNTVIHLYESHETGEGFSFQDEIFEHDGNVIVREITSGGQDCDGPIAHHIICECPLSKLEPTLDPECPPWERIKAWQRDAYAEARS